MTTPLLTFSDDWPVSVTVSDDARICVEGNDYYAWRDGEDRIRVAGGSIVSRIQGESVYIADVLRRCVPADDRRWSVSRPEPFFPTKGLGLLAVDQAANIASDDSSHTT